MTTTFRIVTFLFCLIAAGALRSAADEVADCSEQSFRDAIGTDNTAIFTEDCTITLTNTVVIGPGEDVLIDGGTNNVSITASNGVQMFDVQDGGSLTVSGVKLFGASISNDAGGFQFSGAAIYVEPGGTVVLSNCVIAGNSVFGADGVDGVAGGSGTGKGENGTRGTPGGAALGGAVCNLGDLTVDTCRFFTNAAVGGTGGVGGDGGTSDVRGGNGADGGAGGFAMAGAIFNAGTSFVITNSSFYGNVALAGSGGNGGLAGAAPFPGNQGDGGGGGAASGGAIFSTNAAVDISASTFATNVVLGGTSAVGGTKSGGIGHSGKTGGNGIGGGIAFEVAKGVDAGGGITNCTFYKNAAIGGGGGTGGPGSTKGGNGGGGGGGVGGGLAVVSRTVDALWVVNCTLYGGNAVGGTNGLAGTGPFTGHAGSRGGAHGGNLASTLGKKSTAILNDIFDSPQSGGNLYGKIDDFGHNISSDKSFKLNRKEGDLWPTNAMLKPLRNYGGPTETMAIDAARTPLNPPSPAVDAGSPDGAPLDDQRGSQRDNLPDIGAYEFGALVILTQPQDATIPIGGTNTFSVTASGRGPLTYQWFFNGAPIPGATNSSYTVTNAQPTNAGVYTVEVSNGSQTITSEPATLTVRAAPQVVSGPSNIVTTTNSTTNFTVTVTGKLPMSYQWIFNGTNAPNGSGTLTTNTVSGSGPYSIYYFITNVQASNEGTYSVRLTNSDGTAASSNATLSIASGPVITSQPTNAATTNGGTATFRVAASGSAPLSFQWFFNVTNTIPGATNTTYTITNAQPTNAGTYDVVVTNAYGSATSSNATLTVSNAAPSSASSAIARAAVVIVPPTPPTIHLLPGSEGLIGLTFPVNRGYTYVIESRTSLEPGSWSELSTNVPQEDGSLTVTLPKTNSASFYRVRVQ